MSVATRTWLVLLCGHVVLCAYPDCNFLFDYCVYQIGDNGNAFGNAWFDRTRPASKRDDICNATSWQAYDDCLQNCPLEFVVTEPKEYAMRLCMQDTYFKPFRADAHLDLAHELNGKEYEVVVAGGDKYACSDQDFKDKNYTNKIVLFRQGECGFPAKFKNVAAAGGKVGLMLQSAVQQYLPGQLTGAEGSSLDVPILSFSVVRAGTDFIVDHLGDGGAVKGKVELTCKERKPDAHLWDDCSFAGSVTSFFGGCAHMPDEENRLCTRCPVEATIDNKTLCLRGNTLLPRREVNQMWASPEFSLPYSAADMVYLKESAGGCNRTVLEAHEGKIVFMPMPDDDCLYHNSVIEAQRAGVKGYVLLTPNTWGYAFSIQGTSSIVNISVHSLDPKSYLDFLAIAETMPLVNGAHVFDIPAEYRVGAAPPSTAPITPQPAEVVVDEVSLDKKQFEFTGVVIAMMVLIVLVLIAIVLKIIFRRSVEHVEMKKNNGPHFPLGVASAVLSLTLLSIVTTISFVLAYTNGRDSTDTAIDDGNQAVNRSFENSAEVVSKLNMRWRETVLDGAYQTTSDFFTEGIIVGRSLRDIFYGIDGSWSTFQAAFPGYYALTTHFSWQVMVRTVEGFHISDYSVTDSRDDSVRKDGLQHVSITNNGYLYDYWWYYFSGSKVGPVSYGTWKKTSLDVFNTIGEYIGRWQDYVGGYVRTDYALVWTFSTYSYVGLVSYQGAGGQGAEWKPLHPVTLLLPIHNASGDLAGSVQLSKSVSLLNSAVTDLVKGFSDAQNVTVFVVRSDGVLVTSSYGTSRRVDQYVRQAGMVYAARESYSLDNTYSIELNALGRYLKHTNNGSLVKEKGDGEFEQSAWYNDVSGWWVARFTFEAGSADSSGNNYKSEVRDGGSCDGDTCIAVDSDPKRSRVLHLDGQTVFYMYNNLTIDTPRVSGTRSSELNKSWESSFPLYNNTRIEPDGSELVVSYDAGTDLWNPVLREPFVVEVVTVSMWVKPDVPISDSTPLHGTPTPRMFADTEQGDARMLWYANGMFYLGVENYGCITKPIAGGPPVGVWTHVSVSVDQLFTKMCKVYVNGTLHSEVPVSQYTSVSWPFYEPYRFGQYFQGSIDDIQIFNHSLTDSEAAGLYTTGNLVKEVPKKEWLYNYKMYTTHGTQRMTFSVGILIPKDDVLRSVQESNTATKTKLGVQQENTQTKLNQKMGEALFIVVPILLFCAFGFLVFNDFLTAPFALLAVQMNEVSLMRLTSVDITHSYITEMNVMYRAMQAMVKNLNEFRSFMPASVLLQVSGSEEECEKSTVLSDSRSAPSDSASNLGSAKSVRIYSNDVVQRMALTATKRRAACLMVNVAGWHTFIKDMDGPKIVTAHGELVNNVVDIVHLFRGVCESFSGDRFFAGFNTVKHITGYKLSACEAALELRSSWKLKAPPSIAVVSGDGFTGNMGSSVMKKHTFMSVCVPWGHALERIARAKDLTLLTDDFLAEAVSDTIFTRVVDVVSYAKRCSRLIHVHELVNKHNVAANEWMYQLETIAKLDHWNDFAKSIFSRDFGKAEAAYPLIKEENLSPGLLGTFTALTLCMRARTFEPTVLVYC